MHSLRRKLQGIYHYWAWHATSIKTIWLSENNATNSTSHWRDNNGIKGTRLENTIWWMMIESTHITNWRKESAKLTRRIPTSISYIYPHSYIRESERFFKKRKTFFLSKPSILEVSHYQSEERIKGRREVVEVE